MKKFKVLALIPSLLLCACGKADKWVGTYQFRLGKSDGNHMEITAELTAEKDSKFKDYKVMKLKADLGDNMDPSSALDDIEEVGEIIIPLLDLIGFDIGDKFPELMQVARKELDDFTDIKLYYNVTNVQAEDRSYRLAIGTHELGDRLNRIKKEHPDLKDIVDQAIEYAADIPFLDKNLNLSPKKSKYLFNAFINNKSLKIQVPVSSDDINMQLIWYGMNYPLFAEDDEKLLPSNYMERMPGVKGEKRFGTHPVRQIRNNVVVKDEVAEVNTIFAKEFSNSILRVAEDHASDELGRFAITTVNDERHLQYLPNGEMPTSINGVIYKEGVWTHLEFNTVSVTGDLGKIEGTGKEASITGAEEYKIRSFMKDPFEFRDFNIVDVGLSKVVL